MTIELEDEDSEDEPLVRRYRGMSKNVSNSAATDAIQLEDEGEDYLQSKKKKPSINQRHKDTPQAIQVVLC